MKNLSFSILLMALSCLQVTAQRKFSDNPDSAKFVTSDINNFWIAYDDFKKDSTVNNFGTKYIDIGSDGVKGFIPERIVSSDNLFKAVKKMKAAYEKGRVNTLLIKDEEKQCRSTFYALKYLYPPAQFPPVYFVIGANNSGGTSNDVGLSIGAETQAAHIDRIPYIVAHELIHFEQTIPDGTLTLLQQSIIEGSADFLGELISGGQINGVADRYGEAHSDQLCREFVKIMNGTDYTDWLYGTLSKKDDRPHDLGYWMGYQIAKQYYTKASDKKQAISDIINVRDYQDFLKKSGYLERYLK